MLKKTFVKRIQNGMQSRTRTLEIIVRLLLWPSNTGRVYLFFCSKAREKGTHDRIPSVWRFLPMETRRPRPRVPTPTMHSLSGYNNRPSYVTHVSGIPVKWNGTPSKSTVIRPVRAERQHAPRILHQSQATSY